MTPNQLLDLQRQLVVLADTIHPSWSFDSRELCGIDGELKIAIGSAIAGMDEDALQDVLAHYADDRCGFYPASRHGDIQVKWTFNFADDRSTVVMKPTDPEVRR